MLNYPRFFFLFAFCILFVAALAGAYLRKRRPMQESERADFNLIQTATLTLLGLILGFSFSMSTVRYDLRKTYEEAEANAIGTEYVRADLLPAADGAKLRQQLRGYTALRILFYRTRSQEELQQINADTGVLQTKLWSTVQAPAMAQPTPLMALAVSGMNDVLNSQGYTQAAWWNRIPGSAWSLMLGIAICGNVMIGYGVLSSKVHLLAILPLVVSIALLLIADIDSPRGGFIHVVPQNLVSLQQSFGK